MNIIKKIINYIKQLSLRYKVIGSLIILIAIFVIIHVTKNLAIDTPTANTSTITHVDVSSVSNLSDQDSSISLIGNVSSVSKATILAASSGEVVSLSHSLGDYVKAGSIIASLENSSQRAAVLQAQGTYDSAVAAQKSVSPIDSKSSAINTYTNTYSTLDTVINSQIDTFFSYPTSYGPFLLINSSSHYDYGELSKGRQKLKDEMFNYKNSLKTVSDNDPAKILENAHSTAQDVLDFLNKLAIAANEIDSGATETQLTALNSARSTVGNLISTISSAQQEYRSQSVTTTSSVEANVTTALGGLNVAKANLEKTFVRAPISGTIVSLSITKGDYLSSFSQVAQISNPNALEVDVYVTSDDSKTLSIGDKALIDESTNGTITFIAPAIDPTTGKILVKIGVLDNNTLTDGNTVNVKLDRSIKTNSKTSKKNIITIPIVSAKITPTGPIVFTVSKSNTLIANSVTFGDILGGQVTILSGITPDMKIVKDARGLSEKQEVIINLTK
jgi:RND family efflux transporter MFP subunit